MPAHWGRQAVFSTGAGARRDDGIAAERFLIAVHAAGSSSLAYNPIQAMVIAVSDSAWRRAKISSVAILRRPMTSGFTSAFLRSSQGVGGLAGCDTPSSRGGRVGRVGGRVDGAGGG